MLLEDVKGQQKRNDGQYGQGQSEGRAVQTLISVAASIFPEESLTQLPQAVSPCLFVGELISTFLQSDRLAERCNRDQHIW